MVLPVLNFVSVESLIVCSFMLTSLEQHFDGEICVLLDAVLFCSPPLLGGISLCDYIHSTIGRLLGCCPLMVIMNGLVTDILMHVFWYTIIYFSVGQIPKVYNC